MKHMVVNFNTPPPLLPRTPHLSWIYIPVHSMIMSIYPDISKPNSLLILNPDVSDLTLQMCLLTVKSNLEGEIINLKISFVMIQMTATNHLSFTTCVSSHFSSQPLASPITSSAPIAISLPTTSLVITLIIQS